MDLQYAAVISYPIETIYFSVNGTPPSLSNSNPLNSHDPFLDFLDFVLEMDSADLPSVFTESYSNDEDSVPQDYAEKVCNGFAKLGARGVSIINSSGDFGCVVSLSYFCVLLIHCCSVSVVDSA
jgi:tripeptidyl-peptidase I